ncbi:uncharacterized protein LOC110694538 [Chenopodium quinoa]|uniref:uncharacterized protein LOC110694538 n=1 Tax=Chenopodium quinoa TaxID=63459 RepID=UPI000B77B79F|nr:uncharacterized protein LOC110694538 [Chenopodium quinoa]
MEKVSINFLVAPVLLAMLFMLSTSTAMAIETMPKMPVMVIEEEVVMVQPPKTDDENGNHETNMMIMRSHNRGLDAQNIKQEVATNDSGEVLKCADDYQYCNSIFGPFCCNDTFKCAAIPLAGGLCVNRDIIPPSLFT